MEAPVNKDEIVDLFSQGPAIIEKAIAGLTDNELDFSPSGGGWSIRQIIHHITDGDDLWKTGIKIALGNENAEFSLKWYTTLTQIEWSKQWNYEKRPVNVSLNLFKANRQHIIQLLEFVPEAWTKTILFPDSNGETETVPVGFIIQMQSAHVEHHVKRIVEIKKEIEKKYQSQK